MFLWAGVTRRLMQQVGGGAGDFLADIRCRYACNGRSLPCNECALVCVALLGWDYNLPTHVRIPTLYLVAIRSFLVVRVSRFAWLLSAEDHSANPDVLSRGDVAPAYVHGHAPGSGWG